MHPQHHTPGLTDENTQYLTSSQNESHLRAKYKSWNAETETWINLSWHVRGRGLWKMNLNALGRQKTGIISGRWWHMQSYIPSLKEGTFHSSRFSGTLISTPAATDWKQREITDTNGAMRSLLWQWRLTFFFMATTVTCLNQTGMNLVKLTQVTDK